MHNCNKVYFAFLSDRLKLTENREIPGRFAHDNTLFASKLSKYKHTSDIFIDLISLVPFVSKI